MYHYIRSLPVNTPDKLGYGLSVAPRLFDEQLSYLNRARFTSVSLDQVVAHMVHGAPLPPRPVVLSFDDGYEDFYTTAFPLLRKHHLTATTYLVVNFLGKPRYMTWRQAREIQDAGMEIGAHTMDHLDLTIQPLAQARHQILDSAVLLRRRLAAPVRTFAYPSGRYNATVLRLVAEAGFTSAVTTQYGDRQTVSRLLTMPRLRVPGGISMAGYIASLGHPQT